MNGVANMSGTPCVLLLGADTVVGMSKLVSAVAVVLVVVLAPVRALTSDHLPAAAAPIDPKIASLRIAPESGSATYRRSYFKHWVDENKDCQDTRAEVLVLESLSSTHGGCRIRTGRWWSWYDGVYVEDTGSLDIDHVVALKEAWESGASTWTEQQRERFANDLTRPETLTAVSATQNRRKSDKDPAQWLPPMERCRYVASWVAVKLRWKLTVDQDEYDAIRRVLSNCP